MQIEKEARELADVAAREGITDVATPETASRPVTF